MVNFNTVTEMLVMAKRNLSHDEWDYINGAAESETSLRRNRLALDCLAFRPRILRDVRNIDVSTTLLGSKLRMPVVLAPIGGLQRMTKNGANDVDTRRRRMRHHELHQHCDRSQHRGSRSEFAAQ